MKIVCEGYPLMGISRIWFAGFAFFLYLCGSQYFGIMNFEGIVLGLVAFICIGMFHPIVIKAEYYIGTRCWWVFALVGILSAAASLFISNTYLSAMLGVFAFSCFWSILELFEQKKRVEKGWFPRNPNKR